MIYQQINHQQQNIEQNRSQYGNNIVICHPNCMLGPHYYIFFPSLILISVFLIVLYTNVVDTLSPLWSHIIVIVIIIWMISYLLIGFSNPGIVISRVQNGASNQANLNMCAYCGVIKQSGVRHCKDCDCCIQEHDHHCPWIGKCVGKKNKGRFYFFVIMLFAAFIVFFTGTISTNLQNSKQIQ